MKEFDYSAYILVEENEPQNIVTLDDEKLRQEFGNEFAQLCIELLLTTNAIRGLASGNVKDEKKEQKLMETKVALKSKSIKGFEPDKLLKEVDRIRQQNI